MLNSSRVCIRRKFAQSMRTPAGNDKDAKAGSGTKRTCRDRLLIVGFRCEADMRRQRVAYRSVAIGPMADIWLSGVKPEGPEMSVNEFTAAIGCSPLPGGRLEPLRCSLLDPEAGMRRRDFLRCLGGGAATWPLAASAQQTTSRTIGWFSLRSADTDSEKSILTAFRQGLSQTGYVEGRNLTIEFGFADGQYDRLPVLAADLVRRRVEVLVTAGGTNITRVAQAATTTIPIIFATANDPVQDGLVKSITRPGGNSTGAFVLNTALLPKRFELLRQLLSLGRLPGEPEGRDHGRPDPARSIRRANLGAGASRAQRRDADRNRCCLRQPRAAWR
jgi:hypothetical protein